MKSITRWARLGAIGALLAAPIACNSDRMTATDGSSDGPPSGDPPSDDPPADPPSEAFEIILTAVAGGLERPVQLLSAPGDGRLFIVEQGGQVRVLAGGELQATPYLDIGSEVSSGNEQGLLGMAFHPGFQSNGFAYVNYTDVAGDTRVVRYTERSDGSSLDPGSAKEILFVDQPFGNHNGGQLLFDGDGLLYVALGDGGSGGDPQGNGQNPSTLLGSLLRLDVDGGDPYAIPPDNPFASGGGRPEIWAYGLRNPWRNEIDVMGGFMYVADVGQNTWEEVSVAALDEAGVNYGWSIVEGPECFQGAGCDRTGLTEPAISYDHGEGCSIVGGHVYRGEAIGELAGVYLYSDFCAGWLRSFRWNPTQGTAVEQRTWSIPDIGNVRSFGKDADGELYLLTGDRAYRIDPAR